MRSLLRKLKRKLRGNQTDFPGSMDYWEKRYSEGGTSGEGSYDALAEFKAEIINAFVRDQGINTVIEFGCGDGNQLKYGQYPNYIGLDVSKTAIQLCIKKFQSDRTKSFFLYDSFAFADNHSVFRCDLSMSLDVIYHLVEDQVFERYLKHVFSSGSRYVIIYSSDEEGDQVYHEKNRSFSKWVRQNIQGWQLKEKIKNKYPEKTKADFFIYEKI